MRDVFIVDAVRTPRGRGKAGKGALSGVHPQELLAQTLNRLAAKTGIRKQDVEDVVVGCVTQAGEQGAYIARTAMLAAGWPDAVTGVTLNRFCGSGAQAVNFAAMGVMSGQQEVAIGGGVESMSRVPMGSDGARLDGNNLALRKKLAMVPQGISADLIATLEGFSREDVDRFALESQRKAERAAGEGRFAKSLFTVVDLDGKPLLDRDEHPRAGATMEALAKLEPAFASLGSTPMGPAGETVDALALARYPQVASIQHVHTAGNSSGIVDGAAVVLLASGDYVKAHGLKPRGADPRHGDGRRRAGDHADGACARVRARPPEGGHAGARHRSLGDQRGVRGGAAADGAQARHRPRPRQRERRRDRARAPARRDRAPALIGTALDELERAGKATALITLCIGGGMGVGHHHRAGVMPTPAR